MMPLAQSRQFTCRYWALGPKCPNVAPNGRITCPYAHRDTGQLIGELAQPGTCLAWAKNGVCLAYNCCFEHRQTGVTGFNQGPLQLAGIECEIADAAHTAGFNTHDHSSLYKLIWAVKRVGLKSQSNNQGNNQQRFGNWSQRFGNPPPPKPKHPIYPDNYRPSGVGDNTNAKRKRKFDAGAVDASGVNAIDVNAGGGAKNKPLRFHPKKPLMRRGGNKNDPISILDSDDEVTAPAPANSSKRRKVGDGKAVAGAAPSHQVVNELLQVKSRLVNARRDMNKSQGDMKNLFDKHYKLFDDDEVMQILEELSKNMNTCFDGSKAGMESIERALAWLNGSGRTMDMKIE